jgi:ACT domain-containing protein
MFAMIMMADISKLDIPFAQFSDEMTELGNKLGLKIYVMHEDIFNCMHTI